jgi:hypothetical protein
MRLTGNRCATCVPNGFDRGTSRAGSAACGKSAKVPKDSAAGKFYILAENSLYRMYLNPATQCHVDAADEQIVKTSRGTKLPSAMRLSRF